jgi:rubrerythrin
VALRRLNGRIVRLQLPVKIETSRAVRSAASRRRRAERRAPARSSRAIRPEDRARRAGGPDDRALYTCACGYAFQADVTASVRCPHCGVEQAW